MPPPQKTMFLPNLSFRLLGVHALGADLDRVEDVDAHVDQVGNVWRAVAAGVIPDLGLGVFLDGIDHSLLARADDLAIELGRKQRPVLAGQVVADHDDVEQVADFLQEALSSSPPRTAPSGRSMPRRTPDFRSYP